MYEGEEEGRERKGRAWGGRGENLVKRGGGEGWEGRGGPGEGSS